MEFRLSYNNHQQELTLPVNPGEFTISTGNNNTVVDIQNLGELNLIGTRRLAEIELVSFFPANPEEYGAQNYQLKPYEAVAMIAGWRTKREPIRLIITDTSFNLPVSIEEFEYGEHGGTRDVNFTLRLKEYRFIKVSTITDPTPAGMKAPRPETKTQPKTYTVKAGDNLFLIAKKQLGDGSKWRSIYTANTGVIGKDPNLIKPGQKLVIPA